MKNKILFLLPISLLLAGCSLKFDVIWNKTSSSGLQGSNQVNISYEYFEGDDLGDVSIYTAHTLTMKKELSTVDFKAAAEVKEYITDADSIISSIDEINYLAKNPYGLRVGNVNEERVGNLTLHFTKPVEKVSIIARPYKGVIETLEGTQVNVDQNASLSVNNSKFIRLNHTLNADEEVEATTCNYILTSNFDTLSIVSGPERAVIEQIILYC